MNISASKFSSECESGWTFYLDQSNMSESEFQRESSNNNNNNNNNNGVAEFGGQGIREMDEEEEEEEEDLSMVSDASSGPPHYFHEDCTSENGSSFSSSNWAHDNHKSTKKDKEKKKMTMKEEKCKNVYHSYLDDTASSPLSKKKSSLSRSEAFMENRLDYSQGFSATHFKGESAFGNHFGLGSASQKPGDFQGGNWK